MASTSRFHQRINCGGIAAAGLCVALAVSTAQATLVQSWSGLSSTGIPVSFEAQFTIAGDTLTIDLFNNSPVSTANPADLLSSFYFDVICNGVRPTLTYQSATGDVWRALRNSPDTLVTANANLKAVAAGDNTWQFKDMNPGLTPMLGFGIGTVGNSSLSPNNFMGNVVDGRDYSIYTGEITTQNLNDELLVKNTARFVFTGVSGCSEADISAVSVFGLGTGPDSLGYTPEPATLALLACGLLGLRRRNR